MKLIITADWHLRDDLPRCRVDENWIETQLNHVSFVLQQSEELECPIAIVGDVFDKPVISDYFLSELLALFLNHSQHIYILPGNHDLLYHSWKYLKRGSFSILWNIAESEDTVIRTMNGLGDWVKFGQTEPDTLLCDSYVFTHELVFKNEKQLPPNTKAITAQFALDKYSPANWIFLGDNHTHFHYVSKDKKHVINPGCLNRQTVDMIDYEPVIYFVDTETNDVEIIEIPDNHELVNDTYIQEKHERDDRVMAFAEAIKDQENVSFSFQENVQETINNNKDIDKKTVRIIEDILAEASNQN